MPNTDGAPRRHRLNCGWLGSSCAFTRPAAVGDACHQRANPRADQSRPAGGAPRVRRGRSPGAPGAARDAGLGRIAQWIPTRRRNRGRALCGGGLLQPPRSQHRRGFSRSVARKQADAVCAAACPGGRPDTSATVVGQLRGTGPTLGETGRLASHFQHCGRGAGPGAAAPLGGAEPQEARDLAAHRAG